MRNIVGPNGPFGHFELGPTVIYLSIGPMSDAHEAQKFNCPLEITNRI